MSQSMAKIRREIPLPGMGKRWFYKLAQYFEPFEHMHDVQLNDEFLAILRGKGVDLFSFIDRTFLYPSIHQSTALFRSTETIGLLQVNDFDSWLKSLPARERSTVRKAERTLTTKLVKIDEEFMRSAFRIYNETPIRQRRKYTGYGLSLEDIRKKYSDMGTSEVIGAYLGDQMIGLLWLDFGDRVAAMMSFLSLISYRNKNPNNSLIAAAVKRCSEKGYRFLTYGNMGYNPSLDFFKKNNGFRMFTVPRYYVPLTSKGQLAVKLNLYKSIEHAFSPTMTRALVPFYNIMNKALPVHTSNPAEA